MFKKFAVMAVLIFGMAVFYGCSKSPVASTSGTTTTPTTDTPTTGTSTIKISGTVTIPNADLEKLGMSKSTSSISSMSERIGPLATATNTSPLPFGNVIPYYVDPVKGNVAIPNVVVPIAKNGSFSLSLPAEYANKMILCQATAENLGSTITMGALIVAQAGDNLIPMTPAEQLATKLLDAIKGKLSPELLPTLRETFIKVIEAEMAKPEYRLPTFVSKTGQATDPELDRAVLDLQQIDQIKIGNDMADHNYNYAESYADINKGEIFFDGIFSEILGKSGLNPEQLMRAFAEGLRDNKKISITKIVNDLNSIAGLNINASSIVTNVNIKINELKTKKTRTLDDSIWMPVILSSNQDLKENDELVLPLCMYVIKVIKEYVIKVIKDQNTNISIDYFQLFKKLGIYNPQENTSIDADIQIVSYSDPTSYNYNPNNPAEYVPPTMTEALFVNVKIFDDRGMKYLEGVTVTLTYPNNQSSTSDINVPAVDFSNFMPPNPIMGGGGYSPSTPHSPHPMAITKSSVPPVGDPTYGMFSTMKTFQIAPMDPMGIAGKAITDFRKSDGQKYIIKATIPNDNNKVISKEIVVSYVKSPAIEFDDIKQNEVKEFITGKPSFKWIVKGEIPQGYKLKYGISLIQIYPAFKDIKSVREIGKMNDLTSFSPEEDLEQGGTYQLDIRPILIKNDTNVPIPGSSVITAIIKIVSNFSNKGPYAFTGDLINILDDMMPNLKVGIFKKDFASNTDELIVLGIVNTSEKKITINGITTDNLNSGQVYIVAWEDKNKNNKLDRGSWEYKDSISTYTGEKDIPCKKMIFINNGGEVKTGYWDDIKKENIEESLTETAIGGFDFDYSKSMYNYTFTPPKY